MSSVITVAGITICQLGTVNKRAAVDICKRSGEIDDRKACTAVERVGVDLTNGIAQRYAFKTSAAVKRKIADSLHTVFNNNFFTSVPDHGA